jgi:cytochrome c5
MLSNKEAILIALSVMPLLAAAEGPNQIKGRAVYEAVCAACHSPGNVMVSAPKAGDAKEWARRASRGRGGLGILVDHAVDGFEAMPPKGGNAALTREQVRDAILYMGGALVAESQDELQKR